MKKTDIAMIALVASMSGLFAYILANSVFSLNPPKEGVKVQVVDKYSSTVVEPDEQAFKEGAINPTVKTIISGK